MGRKKVFIGLTAVLIVVSIVVAAYYVVFQRPIKAPAEDLALNTSDLPGWTFNRKMSEPTSQDVIWSIQYYFSNSTVDIGNNLTLALRSYSSSDAAHHSFSLYAHYVASPERISGLGDESFHFPSHSYSIDTNGTYRCIEVVDWYIFRVANVLVNIWFEKGGSIDDYFDPNGSYHRAWMDEIAQIQADKLEEHNIHLF